MKRLTTHPDVAVVSFTGSTAVGKLVNQNAAPHFKKVHLEMGGKNPIMIMDDANLELALEGCLWGGFGTTGQRCTAASRVIVHEKVHDRFVEQFVARAKALRVGNGLEPATQVGPSISDKQLQKVMSYVEIGKQEGATVACGGRRLNEGDYEYGLLPRTDGVHRRDARRCGSRARRSSGRSSRCSSADRWRRRSRSATT